MTARSEHSRYVRGLASRIAAESMADTAVLRDGVVNNTNHLLDQRGIVIAALSGSWTSYESEDTGEFHQLYGLLPIEFPITLLPSGRSAAVVPHLRGYVSGGAGTGVFRVRISRIGGENIPPELGDRCTEVSTTSTTGEDLAPDPIFLPREEADASIYGTGIERPFPSLDGSGDAAVARVSMAQIEVWAKISSGVAQAPVLVGLTLREYIGG